MLNRSNKNKSTREACTINRHAFRVVINIYSVNFLKTKLALWPPNPKELETAT